MTKTDDNLVPYVPNEKRLAEFTVQAAILGFVLSIVFNAANAYLGLKIGLTISASIPSAIISMTALRVLLPALLKRNATILENNIVHTIASNGESLAAAVIFTVPALIFLGAEITNLKVFLLGAAGGILGMLMMIPLRQSFVVHEHHSLPFPEGRACAQVLIAGDKGGASAAPVLAGIAAGGLFKFAMSGLTLFKDVLMWTFPTLHKAGFGFEISPLFVGVGYLIGLRIVAVMFAGGLLGYWVLIPLIDAMGGTNIIYPGTVPVSEMSTGVLRSTYVRYIGAGGVAFGGLISLARAMPDIWASLQRSLGTLGALRSGNRQQRKAENDPEMSAITWSGVVLGCLVGLFALDPWWATAPAGALVGGGIFHYAALVSSRLGGAFKRTEHDLPLPVVGAGILAMALLLWLLPVFELDLRETAIVILFCFFFVAVSARMVGLIGTTNQPVSGMTITALLSMTALFSLLGHDPATLKSAAIMGGAVVCIAIALSGDLSQDLKTAALVGATPWKVQLAEIMGTLISAVRTGFILLILYKAYGFGAPTPEHPHPLEAPQSQLMASLVEGVTGGKLPWDFLMIGAGIGLVAELCGVSALALSIGLYLPITNWPMMLLGGLISWLVARKKGAAADESDPGSLFSSGLIAGDALMGIALAGLTVAGMGTALVIRDPGAGNGAFEALLSCFLYGLIAYSVYRYGLKKRT